jgi:hypothetical protein
MEGGGSERLAAACLGAYGAANYEGYLELGLPVGYGEGIAELLLEIINRPQRRRELTADDFGEGDLERAVVEWLSLLRQITNAPKMEWHRWSEFQAACSAERQKHQHLLPGRDLPPVPAAQLSHQPNHTQIAVH